MFVPFSPGEQEKQIWDSEFQETEQHHLSPSDLKPDFVQMFSLKKNQSVGSTLGNNELPFPNKKQENKIAL